MNIRLIIFLFLPLIATFSCVNPHNMRYANSPNIILIYLDDMGYGDLSLTGATEYKTPNLIGDNLLEVLFPINSYH